MNLPVTGVTIQQAVIPLLQVNPLLTGLFVTPAAVPGIPTALPQIADDDPLTVDPSAGVAVALHLLAENDDQGSLGGSGFGSREVTFYMALIVYVWEANKAAAKKEFLAQLTGRARAALMQTGLRVDPAPSPQQRWYSADFYKNPATVYQNGGGFRRSITFIRYQSRFTTL